ncbi:MAG: hypothetical protein HUU50_22895 [Candidatus Brocadiae bacterium]|nr:hypothetical protein [Candidatus Brocadiia bacterium]
MIDNNSLTADYFSKIQILGTEIDGYVLSNGTACLGERGTARFLGFSTHSVLDRLASNLWAKELEPFIPKDFSWSQTLVKVTANCPNKGSNISVYNVKTINAIARAYSRAYLQGKLRKNQIHIGVHCATLRDAVADVGLEQMIYDSCGYKPKESFSQRVESSYLNAIDIIQELGFTCSLPNDIATKKDILKFLKIPQSTLNSFLRKHKDEIKPIILETNLIHAISSKAHKMYGYSLDDIVKITLGMDTERGIEVKRKLFGHIGTFIKTKIKGEIEWREILSKVFEGLDLHYNYTIGNYRVDFFIPDFFGFGLCLECNGYCHRSYDPQEEDNREKFITERYALVRFHHKISLENLINGILKAKPKKVSTLYDIEQLVW